MTQPETRNHRPEQVAQGTITIWLAGCHPPVHTATARSLSLSSR